MNAHDNASEMADCPTPWCGHNEQPYVWQGPDDSYTVICAECQVEGPHCPTEAEAVEGWNVRPAALIERQSQAVEALVEAVRSFAEAWSIVTERPELVRGLTLAQLGELAAYELSGVHYRNAADALATYQETINGNR